MIFFPDEIYFNPIPIEHDMRYRQKNHKDSIDRVNLGNNPHVGNL
jgi:hypothetical protein